MGLRRGGIVGSVSGNTGTFRRLDNAQIVDLRQPNWTCLRYPGY